MGSNHRMTHIYYSDRYRFTCNGVHDTIAGPAKQLCSVATLLDAARISAAAKNSRGIYADRTENGFHSEFNLFGSVLWRMNLE